MDHEVTHSSLHAASISGLAEVRSLIIEPVQAYICPIPGRINEHYLIVWLYTGVGAISRERMGRLLSECLKVLSASNLILDLSGVEIVIAKREKFGDALKQMNVVVRSSILQGAIESLRRTLESNIGANLQVGIYDESFLSGV